MRRYLVLVVAVVGVFAASGLLFGGPVSGLATIIPVGALALVALRSTMLRSGVDVGWSVPAAVIPAVDVATGGGPTAVASASVPPRPPTTERRLALALARAESSRLSVDLWFGAGLGFCVLLVTLFGWFWAPDDVANPWRLVFVQLPLMAHPMTGMAVAAAHRAVTRARRDGAEELFASCPIAPGTRTAGHLLTAWLPAAAVALFCATYVAVVAVRGESVYGPVDGRALGDVVAAVLLPAGGVALGVALGRWAPWRAVPMVAVAALVPLIASLGNIGAPHWSNARQISTWPQYPAHDLIFTMRPVWWHAAWLAGLTVVVAAVGMARTGARRTVAVAVAAAVFTAVVGIAETRSISHDGAARIASLVAEPERHQSCRVDGRVSVCAYAGYEDFAAAMIGEVAPVMAAAPEGVPPIVHRQMFDGDLADLGPEVARAMAGRPVGDPTAVPLDFELFPATRTAARLRTALAAVGLPTEAGDGRLPVVVAGQARGVVSLWLAARGLDADGARKLATAFVPWTPNPDERPPPSVQDRGMAWPDPCHAGPPPVAWAPEDLAAARAILGRPEASVRRVIHAQWTRFTGAAATTDDLLDALGLPRVGPTSPVMAHPVSCTP